MTEHSAGFWFICLGFFLLVWAFFYYYYIQMGFFVVVDRLPKSLERNRFSEFFFYLEASLLLLVFGPLQSAD